MSAKWAWLLFLGACSGVSAVAQAQPAAPAAGSAGPIQLDVMVTDKAGNPIPGLKQENFKLTDNRQPVTISSFAAHQPGDGTAATVIIVLDNLNANFTSVTTERLQIEDYFRKNGGKLAFPMGVFSLTNAGLDELTPISTDGVALADALHKKIADSPMARTSSDVYADEERLNTSLQALSALGRYLNTDGRKVVVWLGPGWPVIDTSEADVGPVQQQFFFNTVADISRMLRDERITIHSVGMVGSGNENSRNVGRVGFTNQTTAYTAGGKDLAWESFMKPLTQQNKAEPGYIALQVFAMHSGGTVVSGSNDVAKEINRCAQDATAWYTVTFDAQKATAPNTWHDVDLKVDQPKVKVRTENGYYAQP
jgi:VWFA-related protein